MSNQSGLEQSLHEQIEMQVEPGIILLFGKFNGSHSANGSGE